jgi:hypothetical protein
VKWTLRLYNDPCALCDLGGEKTNIGHHAHGNVHGHACAGLCAANPPQLQTRISFSKKHDIEKLALFGCGCGVRDFLGFDEKLDFF